MINFDDLVEMFQFSAGFMCEHSHAMIASVLDVEHLQYLTILFYSLHLAGLWRQWLGEGARSLYYWYQMVGQLVQMI